MFFQSLLIVAKVSWRFGLLMLTEHQVSLGIVCLNDDLPSDHLSYEMRPEQTSNETQ